MPNRAHGTPARYDHGPDEHDQPGKGCRCTPCLTAKSTRRKQHRLEHLQGRSRNVNAEPVRQHIQMLRNQEGMELPAIARAAGINDQVLDHLIYGTASTMRRKNADALLAVRPSDIKTTIVAAAGTQRRLRGLAVAGWPIHVIASRTEVHADALARIMRAAPGGKVTARTAERVKAACTHLWMRNPVAEGVPAGVVTRLRRVSAAKGWQPLLAWDDIDDPTATPELGSKTKRDVSLLEDSDYMIRHGDTFEQAAERLGVKVDSLHKARAAARRRLAAESATRRADALPEEATR